MNKHQRNKNRANAIVLSRKVSRARAMQHTCENSGEMGGHWISTRGMSLLAALSGQDDQTGFWICPKLYGADGRRIGGAA